MGKRIEFLKETLNGTSDFLTWAFTRADKGKEFEKAAEKVVQVKKDFAKKGIDFDHLPPEAQRTVLAQALGPEGGAAGNINGGGNWVTAAANLMKAPFTKLFDKGASPGGKFLSGAAIATVGTGVLAPETMSKLPGLGPTLALPGVEIKSHVSQLTAGLQTLTDGTEPQVLVDQPAKGKGVGSLKVIHAQGPNGEPCDTSLTPLPQGASPAAIMVKKQADGGKVACVSSPTPAP